MKKMIKFEKTAEGLLRFKTIANDKKSFRRKSASPVFILSLQEIERLRKEGYALSGDLYNFLKMSVYYDRLIMNICWLNVSNDTVKGQIEIIEIDYKKFLANLDGEAESFSMLELGAPKKPRIMAYGNNIKAAVKDRSIRKKLARALIKNFNYIDASKIEFFDDPIANSFFFRVYRIDGQPGICGGLIYHKDSKSAGGYYAVHT